jgi:GT2 family glycosyltransferase
LKRWNFANLNDGNDGKTNFIDTTGIVMTEEHRFIDRGQGDIDHGQYDQEEEIFGSSGAAVIYRMSCLEDVAYLDESGKKEYFDELMFMYKEDVDLAYRLQMAGYKSIYTPKATIYHDRSVEAKGKGFIGIIQGRIGRKKHYKEWSWLNHHIILRKMMGEGLPFATKAKTYWYEFKSNAYALVFEPFLIKQWWKLFKLRKEIAKRRDQVKRRVKIGSHFKNIIEK